MFKYLNHLLPIITALLALLELAKDWESHRKSWRRGAVLGLIILVGIGGAINAYYTSSKTDKEGQEAQTEIAGLKKAVETANRSQEDNTKKFVEAFGRLSQKVSLLQTQVKTAGLQREAEELQKELRATQKAMNPPKAVLSFSFANFNRDSFDSVRAATLPVKDGITHFEFTVINAGDVPAIDGEITLVICDKCEFASEPPLFRRLAGQVDTHRTYSFERLLPRTFLKTLSADVRVPPNLNAIEVGIYYRCRNCDVPEPKANAGIIFLSR